MRPASVGLIFWSFFVNKVVKPSTDNWEGDDGRPVCMMSLNMAAVNLGILAVVLRGAYEQAGKLKHMVDKGWKAYDENHHKQISLFSYKASSLYLNLQALKSVSYGPIISPFFL